MTPGVLPVLWVGPREEANLKHERGSGDLNDILSHGVGPTVLFDDWDSSSLMTFRLLQGMV